MNYVRVGGYIPQQPIEDYNDLPNIPVQNQDLTVSEFTPVANLYYRHIGATTASFTKGVIYLYNGTGYIALDGSAYGLATVAKTGSYNDLSNKPTIPDAANNGTLTIQKNGTNVATFGANQSTNKTANITVPTKASDIEALPISGGSITGNLTVGGNLTINGTTTTVDSTTLQVKDKLIEVAHGNTTTLTTPAGLVAPKYDGTSSGALVFDSTGTAYVGDVTLDSAGNIDVSNSELQPLATRTGLVGGNLVQYDSTAQTLKDSGKKISDLALKTDIPDTSGLMPKSGGTFTGEVKFGNTENFQGYYIKRMLGYLGIGTRYADLDSSYKDGTWHRMWRLRFPSGSDFWGKIKITLYGGYSSFNASGVMSKSITCNFNKSNIYNNVGCYDGLGVNVEQDFRISEAIWNATASAWEVLIWQKNLNGNNSPVIMLECWTANNTNYINAFNGITAQPVELTQSTSYSAQRASSTGGTKTVEWATLPVYENPLGEEIATVAMLEDKQDKITPSNKLSSSLVDGLGAAAAKSVDTAITANSTSTNLPTSKAVEDRINAHSGIDKVGTVTGVKMNETTKNPSSGVVDLGTVLTDASKFATSAQGTKADNAMPKSGGEFTGGISAPNISTGTDAANYFQSQKFRGEGDAYTYYHAVDFGFAGHNQVDFHEYGGLYNFYQNTNGASDTGHLVGAFTPDGIKEGETLLKDKYLGKSGGSITGDLTVGGNLTINGTTTTVDSTTLKVSDKLIEVAKDNIVKLTTPAGIVVPNYDGTESSGALVFDGDGIASVGDVVLDASGNIDVTKSNLQPLATRTGLVGGNLVQYDSTALTLKDSGKKIGDLALKVDVSGKLSKTENTGVNVLGTTKSTTTLGGNQLVAPNGIIFAGTAANAGLVTRGICGVSTPDSTGACSKENLYINYDGNNDFNAGRQVVLNAGAVGNHLGSNMYQYTVPRGEIVKNWVEAKGYATTSQVEARYEKPTDGIPKTDLESSVQTSLGKADNALSLDGGTIKKSKTIKMDASANSDGANLKWGTVKSKNPYIGYASDQSDGTFVIGSLLGTNYTSGLAIGGASGNLLWKGTKVATINDIPTNYVEYNTAQTLTDAQKSQARSNIGAGTSNFDGTWGSLSGKPDIVQSTGTSTSSVMSQNATTNAISGKLDKTTYEVNKTINFGQNGALYIGKFKVYDTNVTFEITSTTSVTYSGKLVIAAQNYVIREAKVYGDAANTVTPNIYIKPSTTSDPYIEVYFKPSSWSKNVVHIYGSNIQAEPTDVCTNVPSVPSAATLKPKNALTFELSGTTLTITL